MSLLQLVFINMGFIKYLNIYIYTICSALRLEKSGTNVGELVRLHVTFSRRTGTG